MFAVALYMLIGLYWIKLEHDMFDMDYAGATRRELVCGLTQQIVHYLRVGMVWPLYLAEDLALHFENQGVEE